MRFKVLLEGGLGNQMFQYAFGRSLAERYNAELHISISLLGRGNPPRKYMLGDLFRISCSEGFDVEWNQYIIEPHPYVDGCERAYENLKEGNYIIRGYWQNENYFKEINDKLREEFWLDREIRSDKSLLVQVRRTDFVNNKSHEYCDVNWYKKAISEFDFDEIHFTSDDINWCQRTFDYPNMRFITGNEREQFKNMYGFKNFVISNSSFGWWGSWYSDTENVICPDVWFPADLRWNTARKKWKKLKK